MMAQCPPSVESRIFDCFEIEYTTNIVIKTLRGIVIDLYGRVVEHAPSLGCQRHTEGHVVADLSANAAEMKIKAELTDSRHAVAHIRALE